MVWLFKEFGIERIFEYSLFIFNSDDPEEPNDDDFCELEDKISDLSNECFISEPKTNYNCFMLDFEEAKKMAEGDEDDDEEDEEDEEEIAKKKQRAYDFLDLLKTIMAPADEPIVWAAAQDL